MRNQSSSKAHRATRALLTVAALLALTLVAGCVQRTCDIDGNGEYTKAMRASPSVLVKDTFGDRCDNVDWRFVSNYEDAKATLVFRIGDPFKGHKIDGTIALYDVDAQLLDQASIRPNESKYEFRFPVKARKQYFVKIESTSGVAEYTLETKFEPTDPCAKCNPDQECIQNKCVAKVEAVPVASCKGVCPQGFVCDEAQNLCIVADPCGGPCPNNQSCDEDKGKCVAQWKPECRRDKDCKGDEKCSKGRCKKPSATTVVIAKDPEVPVEDTAEWPKTIVATITQAQPSGKGMVLTLSKGTKSYIKVGATGSIAGAQVKIIEANAYRSRGKVAIDKTQLGNNKSVKFVVTGP